jgi:hypothetical protein
MSENRDLFVEEAIIGAIKRLLVGRVNEVLGEAELPLPFIELGEYRGGGVVVPVVELATCERTEKERVIRVDAYAVTIGFAVAESLAEGGDGERCCYAYAAAVEKAIREDPALGGAADRVVLSGKKYMPPRYAGSGAGWEVVLPLRVTIEGIENAG